MIWSMTDLGVMGGDLGLLDGGLEAPFDVLRVSTVMVTPSYNYSMNKFDGLQLGALNFPDGVGNNSARIRTLPSCLTNS